MWDFEDNLEDFILTPFEFQLAVQHSRHKDNALKALYALLVEQRSPAAICKEFNMIPSRLSQLKKEFKRNFDKALESNNMVYTQVALPKDESKRVKELSQIYVKDVVESKF